MSAPRRTGGLPTEPATVAVWALSGLVAVGTGIGWAAVRLGLVLAGRHDALPGNPFTVVLGLVHGQTPWVPQATWVAAGLAGLVVLVGLAGLVLVLRVRGRRAPVDRAAPHLGRGRSLSRITPAAVRAQAGKLGVPFDGLPLGVTVAGGVALASGPEDVGIAVAGPRSGKTTALVIPDGLAAPGWLVVTSNKRDAADHLRGPREQVGMVWTWDPQGLIGAEEELYWNPLSSVTDENRASQLARLWTTSARPPDAKPDAFFDGAGEELLGHYLHAAAIGGLPVSEVYVWLTRPLDRTAAELLTGAGFPLAASSVLEVIEAPDKQRAGVFGSAKRTVSFLTNTRALRWVVGGQPGDHRREFSPVEFVRSRGTLFALSREGVGDTGPLTTALTVAVCEAAEELAKLSPGGRLATPGTVLLDEAANVCRWYNLPDLYSHYGSRGVLLWTYLQSWSQGVDVWGRSGMRKLWSASTVRIVAKGVSDVEFLSEVAQLIGTYRPVEVSRSSGRGSGSSSSVSLHSEQILEVGDLAQLPDWRAVVLASGCPPTLARTVPWWERPEAAAVRASVSRHDPQAGETLAAAWESQLNPEPDVLPAGAMWKARTL